MLSPPSLVTICLNVLKYRASLHDVGKDSKNFKLLSDVDDLLGTKMEKVDRMEPAGKDEASSLLTVNLHADSGDAPIVVADGNRGKSTEVVTTYLNPMKFDPYHVSCMFVGDSKELKFPSREEDPIDEHAKKPESQTRSGRNVHVDGDSGSNIVGDADSTMHANSPQEQDQVIELDQSDKVDDVSNVKTAETAPILVDVHASGEPGSDNLDQTEAVKVAVSEDNKIHNPPSLGAAGPSQGDNVLSPLKLDEGDNKVQNWLAQCDDDEVFIADTGASPTIPFEGVSVTGLPSDDETGSVGLKVRSNMEGTNPRASGLRKIQPLLNAAYAGNGHPRKQFVVSHEGGSYNRQPSQHAVNSSWINEHYYWNGNFPIIEFPEELLKSNWMPGTAPDYGPHKRPFRFPAWAKPQAFFDIATNSNGHPWGDRNHHVMGPSVMHAFSRQLYSSRTYVMSKMVITGEDVVVHCEDDKLIQSDQMHASVDLATVESGPNLVVSSRCCAPQVNFFFGNHFSRMFRGVRSLKVTGLYHVSSLCALFSHFQFDQVIELDLMDVQLVRIGGLRTLCENLPKLSKLKFNALGTDSPHGLDVMTHIQKIVNRMLIRLESVTVIVATVTVPAALKLFMHEIYKCVSKEVTVYLVQSLDSAVYFELVKIGFKYEGVETRMPISKPIVFGVFSYKFESVEMFVLSPFS